MSSPTRLLYRTRLLCLILAFIFVSQPVAAQSGQTGSITGTVHNGTTDGPAPEGTEVTLHAYNSSYTATETLTTTLDANGRFQFTLNDKPADWVYMVSTHYEDLSFSSNIAGLSGEQPLDLSLTVYETTSDPATVRIDQPTISLNAVGQEVQVSELYSFANAGTAVFTGGDSGGLQIDLPSAAQTPTFERGMGPNSGYFPANEVVQQNGRWLDTVPLRPGPNSLTLRVSYRLPAAGLDLSRTLLYPANRVLVGVPDDLAFADAGWQQENTQSIGERGVLRQYIQQEVAADSTLSLAFSPAAEAVQTPSNSLAVSSASNWILSLGILLLVMFTSFRLLRPGQLSTAVPQLATSAGASTDKAERWQLLFSLADLDNAYKSGQLPESEYQQKRQDIKDRLRNIWEVV